jgi:iron complex outermembrane recepter protein
MAISAGAVHAQDRSGDAIASIDPLEEVVVTAQKRVEKIQEVPMAVQAINADTLDTFHAKQLSDFADYVPGLQVTSVRGYPGQNNITIRGISAGSRGATVATLIDDVPVNSSSALVAGNFIAPDILPYDIARVEILEGPQGTLYGASALGGVLKYVTVTPDLNAAGYRVGADISSIRNGNEAGYGGRALANIPVIPGELAFSVSAGAQHSAGFIDNVATGEKAYNPGLQAGVRLAALWQPNDRLSVKLAVLDDRSDFDGSYSIATTLTGNTLSPTYGRYENYTVVPLTAEVDFNLYTLEVAYDFGAVSLTSLTGNSRARNKLVLDSSGGFSFLGVVVPVEDHFDLDKFSQEFRLSSTGDTRLSWTLGGYFTREKGFTSLDAGALDPLTQLPDPDLHPLFTDAVESRYEEYAGFGNAVLKITDAFDINAGVRFSHNEQTAAEVSSGSLVGGVISPTDYNPGTEDVTTYSVGARYRFSPSVMAYGRVATGFKPGGNNAVIPQTVNAPRTYDADTLTNYEIGLKSQLLDNRLLLNLSVFHIEWEDLQLTQTDGVFGFVANSGSATSDGFELATAYWITRDLKLGLNAAYTDATLDQDQPSLGAAKGDRLPNSAEFTGTLTVDYTRDLSADYTLQLGAIWRYVGQRNTDFLTQPGSVRLDSYQSGDFAAGVSRANWSANLFVRNFTNEYAIVNNGGFADGPILQPRLVGLGVDFRF